MLGVRLCCAFAILGVTWSLPSRPRWSQNNVQTQTKPYRSEPEVCFLRGSNLGRAWFQALNSALEWVDMPCAPGTAFDPATCNCNSAFGEFSMAGNGSFGIVSKSLILNLRFPCLAFGVECFSTSSHKFSEIHQNYLKKQSFK